MPSNMIRDIILKNFPNFAYGETGKYHNVSLADLEKLAEDVLFCTEPREATLDEVSPSIDYLRLDIAGRAMQGILAGPNATKGQRVVSELALSMADALIQKHFETCEAFAKSLPEDENEPTP